MLQILDPNVTDWSLPLLGLRINFYLVLTIVTMISAPILLKAVEQQSLRNGSLDPTDFDSDKSIYISPAFKIYLRFGILLSLSTILVWGILNGFPPQKWRIIAFLFFATLVFSTVTGSLCSFILAIKNIGKNS